MDKLILIIIILAVIIGGVVQFNRDKVSAIREFVEYSRVEKETAPLVLTDSLQKQ